MNLVRVQIDDIIVVIVEPDTKTKVQLAQQLYAYLQSRDTKLGFLAVLGLLKSTLRSIEGVSLDGKHGCITFNGDEESNAKLFKLVQGTHPIIQKIVEITYQITNGARDNFIDHHGNPLIGVAVIPNLSLLN